MNYLSEIKKEASISLIKNVYKFRAYLEPIRPSALKLFGENSQLTVNYFHKKGSIVDFRLASKYSSEIQQVSVIKIV